MFVNGKLKNNNNNAENYDDDYHGKKYVTHEVETSEYVIFQLIVPLMQNSFSFFFSLSFDWQDVECVRCK